MNLKRVSYVKYIGLLWFYDDASLFSCDMIFKRCFLGFESAYQA